MLSITDRYNRLCTGFSPADRMNQLDLSNPEAVRMFVEGAFSDSPKRLAHVMAVAGSVRETAIKLNRSNITPAIDVDEAYCAALLHDIGYMKEIAKTGFHPTDGAIFLRENGSSRIADLIIGHSNSPEQAELLGIEGVTSSNDIVAKLITYWDVQTKQGGKQVSYEERYCDIMERHGEDSKVAQAHRLAQPRIKRIIKEVNQLLDKNSN